MMNRLSGRSPVARIHLPSLMWTLVRTDFKIRYHGSAGGFAWALLRPLFLFLILQAVFSFVFSRDAQFRLNLIIGLFLWDFFVEATRSGLTALATRAHLLTKVRLPTPILIVSSTSNALITLAVFVVFIMMALVLSGRPPTLLHVALFLFYLFQFLAIIVGFSLAASVLFLRFRDLNEIWDLVTQAGFFAAPIVYPLSILPERLHFYLYVWPPTPVIEFSRDVLVNGHVPTLKAHLMLAGEAAVVTAIGAAVFTRLAPRSAELL